MFGLLLLKQIKLKFKTMDLLSILAGISIPIILWAFYRIWTQYKEMKKQHSETRNLLVNIEDIRRVQYELINNLERQFSELIKSESQDRNNQFRELDLLINTTRENLERKIEICQNSKQTESYGCTKKGCKSGGCDLCNESKKKK